MDVLLTFRHFAFSISKQRNCETAMAEFLSVTRRLQGNDMGFFFSKKQSQSQRNPSYSLCEAQNRDPLLSYDIPVFICLECYQKGRPFIWNLDNLSWSPSNFD